MLNVESRKRKTGAVIKVVLLLLSFRTNDVPKGIPITTPLNISFKPMNSNGNSAISYNILAVQILRVVVLYFFSMVNLTVDNYLVKSNYTHFPLKYCI